jgi:hypothetical protein
MVHGGDVPPAHLYVHVCGKGDQFKEFDVALNNGLLFDDFAGMR